MALDLNPNSLADELWADSGAEWILSRVKSDNVEEEVLTGYFSAVIYLWIRNY